MIEPAGEGLTWSHPAGRLCAGELERWWSPNTEEAVGTEKGPNRGGIERFSWSLAGPNSER